MIGNVAVTMHQLSTLYLKWLRTTHQNKERTTFCLCNYGGQRARRTNAEIRSSSWGATWEKAMASARLRTRVETPYIRAPNARRQLVVRQQLDRELDSQISVLNQRRRYRDTALMTLAALSVVVLGELMVHAPSCSDGANIPTILIGGAIKIAGC
jgi:hypothetical protein